MVRRQWFARPLGKIIPIRLANTFTSSRDACFLLQWNCISSLANRLTKIRHVGMREWTKARTGIPGDRGCVDLQLDNGGNE